MNWNQRVFPIFKFHPPTAKSNGETRFGLCRDGMAEKCSCRQDALSHTKPRQQLPAK